MNGYLNNLTLRTLNAGNRVEPRLPALFEPSPFASGPPDVVGSFEEEVTTVSEPGEQRVKAEASKPSLPGPTLATPEISDSAVVPKSSAVKSDEDVEMRFEPVSDEEKREEPVEDLSVRATLQPRTEAMEIAPPLEIEDPVVENDPPLEIDESLSPSLERAGPAPLSSRSSFIDNKAAPGRRTPKRGQAPTVALIPTPSPQADQFQTQLTFRRTTPPDTAEPPPIEVTQNEEISKLELRVTNEPEPEPEFEPTTPPTYRRVNPTPATWRDTRQQQHWRRGPSPSPVEPEPSINVTIGRIEVRAVAPDTRKTTATRRTESPVMPLEDYLRKQRRGGER
jgi:hypothetical protein